MSAADMTSVGVYEAVHSAVVREGWELDSAKVGVLSKGERITAVRRRWMSAETARLLIPGRGWVSTVASDGRQILAPLRFVVRRPLPVYSGPERKPGNRLGNLLLWKDAVHEALDVQEDAVELKLAPTKHGDHRRGWVAAHGLQQLPTDQQWIQGGAPPAEDTASRTSQLVERRASWSNAFDSAGRWTGLPTAPAAAALFSLRWGDGGSDDPVLFVPNADEVISLDELPGVGDQSKLLGSGSFGAVFRSEFRGRQVAVKRCSVMTLSRQVHGQIDRWEVDRERLVALNREVAMMRRMVGVDYVVQYVGVAQDKQCCYIVMDFAPGGSLRTRLLRSTSGVEDDCPPHVQVHRIRSGRRRAKTALFQPPTVEAPVLALRWCERATVAHKLARALTAMHAAGVIHRDLKAENVLLDAEGEPLIADFGLGQADAYATEPAKISGCVAEPEPEQGPELTATDAMRRFRSAPPRFSSPRCDPVVATPCATASSEYGSESEPRQRYRQRNMTLLCGTPRFMAPEVAAGSNYDASVDVYSFGVLMVELLFRDVEACLATARQMEIAERQEETLCKLQLQLEVELQRQRVLSYQMQRAQGERAGQMRGLDEEGNDSGMEQTFDYDWGDSSPATAQLAWRGLRLILREQEQLHATSSESKHRALALAERCCDPSAAERPTAAEVALELETIAQLAHAADTQATGVGAGFHSHAGCIHSGQHHEQISSWIDFGSSCSDGSDGSDAMVDAPAAVQLAPPSDSDDSDEEARAPRATAIQSARDVEVRARFDAERCLDAEKRAHEQLDRSIESVLSEHAETTVALREHLLSQQATDMLVTLPRSASGEYVPTTWWAGARVRG